MPCAIFPGKKSIRFIFFNFISSVEKSFPYLFHLQKCLEMHTCWKSRLSFHQQSSIHDSDCWMIISLQHFWGGSKQQAKAFKFSKLLFSLSSLGTIMPSIFMQAIQFSSVCSPCWHWCSDLAEYSQSGPLSKQCEEPHRYHKWFRHYCCNRCTTGKQFWDNSPSKTLLVHTSQIY